MSSKIGWITARLTPLRRLGDIRLTVNLFKLFLAPLLYQVAGIYLRADPVAREAYERFYRGALKKFLCVPRNMANELLYMLYPPPGPLMERQFVCTVSRAARNQDWEVVLGRLPVVGPIYQTVRHFPAQFTSLLWLIYRECKAHKKMVGRSHLSESHGINVDVYSLLSRFQGA